MESVGPAAFAGSGAEPEPATVDAYLAGVGERERGALEQLRAMIRVAAPDAEECICAGLPAVRAGERLLVGFGVSGEDCVLYPLRGTAGQARPDHDTRKGAIRFPFDQPLPASLVRKLVVGRLAASQARQARPG